MWFECGDIFINLNHVDYICFEESEQKGKATVFFESGDSLNFAHSNVKVLKKHFRKIFEVKNGNEGNGGEAKKDEGKHLDKFNRGKTTEVG